MTDIVEAMAMAVHEHRRRLTPLVISFGWYDLDPEDQRRLMDEQRAAIRAVTDAGGLVLREVPAVLREQDHWGRLIPRHAGWNACRDAFRAAAVEGKP